MLNRLTATVIFLLLIRGVVIADDAAVGNPLCAVCTCTGTNDSIDCVNNVNITLTKLCNTTNLYLADASNQTYTINVLNMSHNPIHAMIDVIPPNAIRVLDVSYGQIIEIKPGVFANMQRMVELILSRNFLDYFGPDTFRGIYKDGEDYPLSELRILRLDYNLFASINQDAFQHIDNHIEELYLAGNLLSTIDVNTEQAITSLLKLKVLDLSDNKLLRLPENFLHAPRKLERLLLADNWITTLSDLHLEHLAAPGFALTELNLDGNQFVIIGGERDADRFPQAPSLRVIHMCRMPYLIMVKNHTFARLEHLEELYMCNNPRLRDIGENALVGQLEHVEAPFVVPLKKLYINSNQLVHLNMELDWSKLNDFELYDNPWTCECENERIIDVIIPLYHKRNKPNPRDLICASPIEMKDRSMFNLSASHYEMRCLDRYNNRPERDGTILVCFLIGLLLGIVAVLFGFYAYQRAWCGPLCCCDDKSPAAFSRHFYHRSGGQFSKVEETY